MVGDILAVLLVRRLSGGSLGLFLFGEILVKLDVFLFAEPLLAHCGFLNLLVVLVLELELGLSVFSTVGRIE